MSQRAEKQIKKLLEKNKGSKYTLEVKIKGEFAETTWICISHTVAKILAKLLT